MRLTELHPLQGEQLNERLTATYAHLIVDKYRAASCVQHSLVAALTTVLPSCVLDDSMQDIFGFVDYQLVDWNVHLLPQFPLISELNRPRRRINEGRQQFGN